MKKLYNAGTLEIEGKTYSIKDNTGVYPISRLVGENTTVFGGRVTRYGMAKDNPNYIMLMEMKDDRLHVIDIAVTDPSHFPREILKKMAKRKKKKFANNILDEDLIKLVK
jgi:hypothetical protein